VEAESKREREKGGAVQNIEYERRERRGEARDGGLEGTNGMGSEGRERGRGKGRKATRVRGRSE